MELEDIEKTGLYKDLLAKDLSKEFNLNIATELQVAFNSYEGGWGWGWALDLGDAFEWGATEQGNRFWTSVYEDKLPEGYQ